MSASGPDPKRADEILDQLLDLDGPDREAHLKKSCGDDRELEALVRRLLAFCETSDDKLLATGGAQAGAFAASIAHEASPAGPDLIGQTIGQYRVVSELGRGGMAVVFLAERIEADFQQQVALKILLSGIPSAEMLRRFHLERQILAQINHPGIAQLLDAGATERGDPYLVMEYVDGKPLDEWCDERRLSVEDRLRMFIKVARVVSHAHRNLVVHRDIKPSNILVTADGDVKLLDFGIAKLVDEDSAATKSDMGAMTPAYASPEQVRGEPVTTATDIYQLGMLLYIMLTGRWPYQGKTTDHIGMLQAICDASPVRPSVVVKEGTNDHTLPGSSPLSTVQLEGTRRATMRSLRRELSGDVDTILIMALRKEPERRYASVEQFAVDVERLLAGQTVSARADTIVYRFRKFIRRNVAATTLAVAAVAAVVVLTVLYTGRLEQERDLARGEAAKATEIADFLRGLFEVSAPTRAKGEEITAQDLLEKGAERIEIDLANQPETRAALELTIGEVYSEMAFYEEAREILERSVATRREFPGVDQLDLANSLFFLGRTCERVRDLESARAALGEALEIQEAALGAHAPETALTRDWLGLIAFRENNMPEARALLEVALVDLEAAYGPNDLKVAHCLNHLALALRDDRELDKSIEYFERALRILDEKSEPGDPLPAGIRVNYAVAVRYNGDLDRADQLLTEATPLMIKAFGENHPYVGVTITNHANLNRERGELDLAEEQQRRAMAVWTEALGSDHVQVAWAWNNLGLIEREREDYPAARAHFMNAVAIVDTTLGPDDSEMCVPLRNLADVEFKLGNVETSLRLYRNALVVYTDTYTAESRMMSNALRGISEVLMYLEEYEEAEGHLQHAARIGRTDVHHYLHEVIEPILNRALCLNELGRDEEVDLALAQADSIGNEDARDMIAEARSNLGR